VRETYAWTARHLPVFEETWDRYYADQYPTQLGFEVEDIGRRAWALLPEGERERAFDELLYTYWEAVASDRETWARYEAGDVR
jgi:hypothetical protein